MSPNNTCPKILMFAGPNGSGKSTVTKGSPIVGLYVNADAIKLERGCSDLEAAQIAEAIRERLLKAKMDFTFETVLSTERNLDLLRRAKDIGYTICAVFVLTCDSSINVERVSARAKAGGHDVPKNKIVSRYDRSLANVAALARIADMLRIVDNSHKEPKLICEVNHGMAEVWASEDWTKERILQLLSMHQPIQREMSNNP